MKDLSPADLLINSAASVATVQHEGQTYGDKYPYTKHLADVVHVLRRFGVKDPNLIAAGWLHDVVEDTDMPLSQVNIIFGPVVADLVQRVTNEPGKNRKERHEKTYIKIKDSPDAVQLKLADRIANVEASLLEAPDKFMMYKKEHKKFKEVLCNPGQHEAMWRHLDFLIGDV